MPHALVIMCVLMSCAGEYHLRFQHFFLDWIIKVANMPPPPPKAQG